MKTLIAMAAAAALTATPLARAQGVSDQHLNNGYGKDRRYEVTITNITQGQYFTPVLAASHTSEVAFFSLGEAPLSELADLAEGGAIGGLKALLDGLPDLVHDTANTTPGMLIGPGESATLMLDGSRSFNRLSLAGMLLPTNDTFVAVNSLPLPNRYTAVMALAYDAGSEANDELCSNIPGPQCGGAPFSAGLAEGFVHVSPGIRGHGDLAPEDYDWRNPVARVTVRRLR